MVKLTLRARHEHPNCHYPASGYAAFQHERIAVRDNEITPLGTMGRVTVFAVTPDELERLRRTLGRSPGG